MGRPWQRLTNERPIGSTTGNLDHVLLTPSRRAAARVLLWVDEGVEYRLESNLDTKAMRSIARSVQIQT